MTDNFDGVFIPKEIWEDKNLSVQEKIFLAHYEQFKGLPLKDVGEFFNLTPQRVCNIKKNLKEKGYIKEEFLSYEEIKAKTNTIEKTKVCEWCGTKCLALQKHHYPIPKREGGTRVVRICPNCHSDFHFIENTQA